jgi:hypothetical protein
MKEIVLVTLAIDTETGEIDPSAPFMVKGGWKPTKRKIGGNSAHLCNVGKNGSALLI